MSEGDEEEEASVSVDDDGGPKKKHARTSATTPTQVPKQAAQTTSQVLLSENETLQTELQQHPQSRVRQYSPADKGPYTVYIREINARMKPIAFALYINDHYKSVELIKHNHAKIRVVFKDREDANRLVTDNAFSDYHAYIPADRVEVNGVITHNDLCDMDTLEELIARGSGKHGNVKLPNVPILDATRLTRLGENNTRELSNLVKVTFSGVVLPKYVSIGGLLVHVRPFYTKAMFCEACQLFGHTAKYCTRTPQCARCAGKHITFACSAPKTPLCPYCKTQHADGRNNCAWFKEANDGFKIKPPGKSTSNWQPSIADIKSKILAAAEKQGLNPMWLAVLESIIDPLLGAILPQLFNTIGSLVQKNHL